MELACSCRCMHGALLHLGKPTAACPHTTQSIFLLCWWQSCSQQPSCALSSASLSCSCAGHIRAGLPHTWGRKAPCRAPHPPAFHLRSLPFSSTASCIGAGPASKRQPALSIPYLQAGPSALRSHKDAFQPNNLFITTAALGKQGCATPGSAISKLRADRAL